MYTHNLSNPADILSGFDPVAAYGDGTTIGNTFVARQYFGGLTAFDSRVQEITPSNTACPSWLLPLSGNLLGTVATNATSNGNIRFFFSDDPGLTASTSSISANCIVHNWSYITTMASVNEGYIISYVIFSLSGNSLYKKTSLSSDSSVSFVFSSSENVASKMIAQHDGYASSTTIMNDIPKMIYWRSNDVIAMLAVDKDTTAVKGSHFLRIKPHWQGFSSSASATSSSGTIINGENFNAIIQINSAYGALVFEGFNMFVSESGTSYANTDGLTNISSAGKLPNVAFSVSSLVKVVTSKLRMSLQPTATPKFICTSDELDNILLSDSSLYAVSTIQLINGNYYLVNGLITDGKHNYNLLLQLSG